MNAKERRQSRNGLWALGLSALLAMGSASAQGTSEAIGIDDSGNYKQEVQACMSGNTQQDKNTCLREARNAQAEKKRGALKTTGDLQANALARCDVFKIAEDKDACRGRIVGHANITGSVAGGGLLRELETLVPAEQTASERSDTQTLGGPQGTSEAPSTTPSDSSTAAPADSSTTAPSDSSTTAPSDPAPGPGVGR